MVMVIIVSKGQFYIKDESGGGTVQNLYEDSLQKFVSGIPDGGYAIRDADGNTPNWITTLQRDSYWRDTFLQTINDEGLHPYMKNDMFDIREVENSYRPDIPHAEFSAVKFAFGIVAEHLGKAEAKHLVLSPSGVIHCLFYVYRSFNNTVENVTPSSFEQIHARWGIEGVRQFLTMYLETPVLAFPEGSVFKNLMAQSSKTSSRALIPRKNITAILRKSRLRRLCLTFSPWSIICSANAPGRAMRKTRPASGPSGAII